MFMMDVYVQLLFVKSCTTYESVQLNKSLKGNYGIEDLLYKNAQSCFT